MEDFEGDTVCKVMEMLNFSVISNEKLKDLSNPNLDGSIPFNEQQNKENEVVNNDTSFHDDGHGHHQPQHEQSHVRSPCEIVKERELAYQCMMLGTDLFIAREENVTMSNTLTGIIRENEKLKEDLCKLKEERAKLSKRLKDSSMENEVLGKELCKVKAEKAKLSKKLNEVSKSVENGELNKEREAKRKLIQVETKRKLIQNETRLLKLEFFSTEFQCEVQTFLSALSKSIEDSGKLDLERETIEIFLKLLMEISGKVPVYVLKDWDETKAIFKKLNKLFTPETISTTTGSPPNPVEIEKQSSPTEVTTTTASPPSRNSDEEDIDNVIENNNKNSADDNEDILILEENVSSSRPSLVITRTTQPKPPAVGSSNHSNICVFCGAKYTNSELLVEHLALFHNGCLPCKISFANKEMLNRHIQFTHQFWQPESQSAPANFPISKPGPRPNSNATCPPSTGESSKTRAQTNNIRLPSFPNLCSGLKQPKHGMVSSDPKDVWNKCLCGYAFMSKKELCVHILSNNIQKSS